MSAALREGKVDVRPLLGLLGQEGGDAASEAARLVLTGLAVARPLVVVPEVRCFWRGDADATMVVVVVAVVVC